MFKQLLTLAVVTVAAAVPAVASTAHDFDPSSVSTTRSLDGQCYPTTPDNNKVCFMRLTGETYSVAIKDVSNPEFPQVMVVDCNAGQYRGFGPLQEAEVKGWADHFCKVGRY